MDTQTKAKKAAIIKMMYGFPSSQDRVTPDMISAYLSAVEKVSAEAVERSCTQFATGRVAGHNNAFLPTTAELSSNARQWDEAVGALIADRAIEQTRRLIVYPIGAEPPPPAEPLGPIKMEIEGIMRDTSEWTPAEKDEALRTGRMPASRTIGADPKRIGITPSLKRL